MGHNIIDRCIIGQSLEITVWCISYYTRLLILRTWDNHYLQIFTVIFCHLTFYFHCMAPSLAPSAALPTLHFCNDIPLLYNLTVWIRLCHLCAWSDIRMHQLHLRTGSLHSYIAISFQTKRAGFQQFSNAKSSVAIGTMILVGDTKKPKIRNKNVKIMLRIATKFLWKF